MGSALSLPWCPAAPPNTYKALSSRVLPQTIKSPTLPALNRGLPHFKVEHPTGASLKTTAARETDTGRSLSPFLQILWKYPWLGYAVLMARTADGTWRMSYRSFCRTMDITMNLLVDFRCPDDPTPALSRLPTVRQGNHATQHPQLLPVPRDSGQHFTNIEGFRHDNLGSRTTEGYLGVPPS